MILSPDSKEIQHLLSLCARQSLNQMMGALLSSFVSLFRKCYIFSHRWFIPRVLSYEELFCFIIVIIIFDECYSVPIESLIQYSTNGEKIVICLAKLNLLWRFCSFL